MNQAYAIADDFLPYQEHLGLWDAFQGSVADTREWNRSYQLRDGDDPVSSKFQGGKPSLWDSASSFSPGPMALRRFSEKLFALLTGDRPPISLEPWTDFSASAWVYRPGHGLEWHSDAGRVAGYIYYMHPAWRSSWGGELLVASDDGSASGAPAAAPSDNSRSAVETVCTTGGVFIYPRPNRLVLLRGGTLHCVKKVESAAGKAIRASMAGFFFNAGTVETSG